MKLDNKPLILKTPLGGYSAEISDLQIPGFPVEVEYEGLRFKFLQNITMGAGEDAEFAGKQYITPGGITFTIYND